MVAHPGTSSGPPPDEDRAHRADRHRARSPRLSRATGYGKERPFVNEIVIVIVRRVRALIARADHPGTPPAEAAAARAIADQLVRKHGLRTLDPGQAMREPPPRHARRRSCTG